MATLYARAAGDSMRNRRRSAACVRALAWIDNNAAWLNDQQIHLTEIPAPEFKEAPRAEYAEKNLFEAARPESSARQDRQRNRRTPRLRSEQRHSARRAYRHRFPAGADIKSNAMAIASPLPASPTTAQVSPPAGGRSPRPRQIAMQTTKTIILAGDVGAKKAKATCAAFARWSKVTARASPPSSPCGWPAPERITTQGMARTRFEIAITGPGGHSWSDFRGPQSRPPRFPAALVKFTAIPVPDNRAAPTISASSKAAPP